MNKNRPIQVSLMPSSVHLHVRLHRPCMNIYSPILNPFLFKFSPVYLYSTTQQLSWITQPSSQLNLLVSPITPLFPLYHKGIHLSAATVPTKYDCYETFSMQVSRRDIFQSLNAPSTYQISLQSFLSRHFHHLSISKHILQPTPALSTPQVCDLHADIDLVKWSMTSIADRRRQCPDGSADSINQRFEPSIIIS